MRLEVSTNQISWDTAVVTLKGQLVLGGSLKAADAKMKELIAARVTKIVIDLASVPYVDSAGLGALVHAYGLAKEAGGALRLCGVQDRVAAMLKLSHTDRYFSIDADVKASLAALA